MPGEMPLYFGGKAPRSWRQNVNSSANGTVREVRKVITSDSPKAAKAFGQLSAETVLEAIS